MPERIETLRKIPLFQGLNEEALSFLAGEARVGTFETGDNIFYRGDPGTTCHVIMRGRVKIFVIGEDGRELAVRILGPGEIVGEMALFEELPRSANVEAMERTETLELNRDVLLTVLRRSPVLALSLLRAMSARLRHATEEAEYLASLTVVERLLRRLQQLAGWAGVPVPEGVKIMLPLTQQELAALVGTSRESVNRALVQLRRQGKVRMKDGWFILPE